jgi:hypothetical protein
MNRTLLLWLVILTGPVIWFIDLEANFAVAAWVCQWQSRLVLAVLSAASLVIVAASAVIAWREWHQLRAPAAGPRPRAMAIGGMTLSAVFFVVIVAQAVPTLLLDGCQ